MERTRLLCYNIFNSSMNRTKSVGLQEFMPFEWDNKKEEVKQTTQHSTKEEFDEMKALINNLNTENNG